MLIMMAAVVPLDMGSGIFNKNWSLESGIYMSVNNSKNQTENLLLYLEGIHSLSLHIISVYR